MVFPLGWECLLCISVNDSVVVVAAAEDDDDDDDDDDYDYVFIHTSWIVDTVQ